MRDRFIDDVIARKKQQQPQFDYMWRVELPSLSNITDSSGSDVVMSYMNRFMRPNSFYSWMRGSDADLVAEVTHRVYEVNTPFHSFTPRKSVDGNSFRYAVDHIDIGSLTMVIDEMEDGLTLEYLNRWKTLMSGPKGERHPPAIYKRNIRVYRRSRAQTDGNYTDYINYFPTEINPIGLTQDGTGIMQYNVTFTGDDSVDFSASRDDVAWADAIKTNMLQP